MALLISHNPDAQEKIIKGICKVMVEHSDHSRKAFRNRLNFLSDTPRDLDVVMVNYCESGGHPEFGLYWHRTSEEQERKSSQSDKNRQPYMVGALVFHSFNDNWGIHT